MYCTQCQDQTPTSWWISLIQQREDCLLYKLIACNAPLAWFIDQTQNVGAITTRVILSTNSMSCSGMITRQPYVHLCFKLDHQQKQFVGYALYSLSLSLTQLYNYSGIGTNCIHNIHVDQNNIYIIYISGTNASTYQNTSYTKIAV